MTGMGLAKFLAIGICSMVVLGCLAPIILVLIHGDI